MDFLMLQNAQSLCTSSMNYAHIAAARRAVGAFATRYRRICYQP